MLRIFITGGSGYIGSTLINKFKECDMIQIYNYDLHNGQDISNFDQLFSAMTSFAPTVVIHLAALSDVSRCNEDYSKMYNYNILGTQNVMKCVVLCSVERLIFASSCAVYGDYSGPSGIVTEECYCRPKSLYGFSKLSGEHIVESYARKNPSLNYLILRFFNIVGYSPYFSQDNNHASHNRLLPLSRDKIFTIYGNDYNTSDGTAIRDYVSIEDLVYILLFLSIVTKKCNGIFNIASGTGTSVLEMLHTHNSILGYPEQVLVGDRRLGDAEKIIGDASKLARIFGLEVSKNISDILRSYINV